MSTQKAASTSNSGGYFVSSGILPSEHHPTLARLLSSIIFPSLAALAAKYMFVDAFHSDAIGRLRNTCLYSNASDLSMYTGIPLIDNNLCLVLTFFQTIIETPDANSFLTYFIGISSPLIALPFIESMRLGRSYTAAFPGLWLCLGQVLTMGVAFPLYWMSFILSGDAKNVRQRPLLSITLSDAEALILGILVGAVIPSVAMLLSNDNTVTLIWQAFPIYIAAVKYLRSRFFPVVGHSKSGVAVVQALFLGSFIISSSTHVAYAWPLFGDVAGLKTFFLPTFAYPPDNLPGQLLNFLRWDFWFAHASTVLATLWYAQSLRQLVTLILWHMITIPFIGSGASVMGVAIWVNGILDTN